MRFWQGLGAVIAAGMTASVLVAAAPDSLGSTALSRLETGQYELKVIGSAAPARTVCVADAAMLIQLQHPGAACSRFLVADGPDNATVNYRCAAGGHGRTVVTITTPRSFDLQTQGIAGGAPFDLDYQGRRVGACGGRSTPLR